MSTERWTIYVDLDEAGTAGDAEVFARKHAPEQFRRAPALVRGHEDEDGFSWRVTFTLRDRP